MSNAEFKERKCQEEKQKLVDICFSIAIGVNKSADGMRNNEEIAEWVANQLRACGFDTQPVGMSWGVLK